MAINIKNNIVTISGAILFKETKGKKKFLLVKPKPEDELQIPKVTVRRGESSVRAALRMTSEQAGMNAKIIEEVGRFSGVGTVNGRSVQQKYYFYLMLFKVGGEMIGIGEHAWLEYAKAAKKLSLKREKDMLSQARETIKIWEKNRKKRQEAEL